MLRSFKIDLGDGTPVLVRPVEVADNNLPKIGIVHRLRQSRHNRFVGARFIRASVATQTERYEMLLLQFWRNELP